MHSVFYIVSGNIPVVGMPCSTNVDCTNALANTECSSLDTQESRVLVITPLFLMF